MNHLFQPRMIFLLLLIGCSTLLLTAIFVEPFASMEACPMCMMQRAVFILIAGVSLIASLHNPGTIGTRIYGAILALGATGGAMIAARQIWLQHLPEDRVPACGPGLDYMLEVFPILEVIEMAIRGTGDCAKVQWTFAGLSIPGWSLIAFTAIALVSLWLIFRRNKDQVQVRV